jgi:hypothetical protein
MERDQASKPAARLPATQWFSDRVAASAGSSKLDRLLSADLTRSYQKRLGASVQLGRGSLAQHTRGQPRI